MMLVVAYLIVGLGMLLFMWGLCRLYRPENASNLLDDGILVVVFWPLLICLTGAVVCKLIGKSTRRSI